MTNIGKRKSQMPSLRTI